jgi:hypothetical protein
MRMARVMDNRRFEGYLLNNLAQIALAQGQIDQSWEFTARALAAGQTQGFPWVESEAHGMRGDIFMVTGIFDRAIQEYQQGAASPVPGFHVLDNLCQLGLALAFSGDSEADRDHRPGSPAAARWGLAGVHRRGHRLSASRQGEPKKPSNRPTRGWPRKSENGQQLCQAIRAGDGPASAAYAGLCPRSMASRPAGDLPSNGRPASRGLAAARQGKTSTHKAREAACRNAGQRSYPVQPTSRRSAPARRNAAD